MRLVGPEMRIALIETDTPDAMPCHAQMLGERIEKRAVRALKHQKIPSHSTDTLCFAPVTPQNAIAFTEMGQVHGLMAMANADT